MSEHISIITANTQQSRALANAESIEQFSRHDAVLLQEVTMPHSDLGVAFTDTDLVPAIARHGLGLAILIHKRHTIISTEEQLLQPASKLASFAEHFRPEAPSNFRLRARGAVYATIETEAGTHLNVGTTHPTVPLKAHARAAHIAALMRELPDTQLPLIIGGDMNHWPSPRQVDQDFYAASGLQTALTEFTPTFDVTATKYHFLGKLANFGIPVNGQLDALLYRGNITVNNPTTIAIDSDHRALQADFYIG